MRDGKIFSGVFAAIMIVNLILLGVGIWIAVELTQWITTK